jgi:septal ring factor EnvC (AmiA/AmiB activator)
MGLTACHLLRDAAFCPFDMKAAIVILIILSVLMGGGLLWRHTTADRLHKQDLSEKIDLTNQLTEVKGKLDDQEKMGSFLQKNLDQTAQKLAERSNEVVRLSGTLAKTQQDAQAAADAAKAEMAKRDAKINELEAQNTALDKQANELKGAIGNLEKSIAETEKKLAASEGDREFLLKELKRLQAEKAELERQFNDLAVLRAQVSKLKDELSIARRLEWIRMGIYGMQNVKGAERLLSTNWAAVPGGKFDLNVELKQDGGATVAPTKTNAGPVTLPR